MIVSERFVPILGEIDTGTRYLYFDVDGRCMPARACDSRDWYDMIEDLANLEVNLSNHVVISSVEYARFLLKWQ